MGGEEEGKKWVGYERERGGGCEGEGRGKETGGKGRNDGRKNRNPEKQKPGVEVSIMERRARKGTVERKKN